MLFFCVCLLYSFNTVREGTVLSPKIEKLGTYVFPQKKCIGHFRNGYNVVAENTCFLNTQSFSAGNAEDKENVSHIHMLYSVTSLQNTQFYITPE